MLMLILCTATLFRKLPNLQLAVPFDKIKYNKELTKDIGILELPVTF